MTTLSQIGAAKKSLIYFITFILSIEGQDEDENI